MATRASGSAADTGAVHTASYATVLLDSWLPGPPAAVWPLISDPRHINRWSTAPVHGLEPGDGGGFGTVGALRQVVLPWPLPAVTEAVQHADAPSRFTYRVVGSRAVRHHRGELRLSADNTGTRLTWEVRMALAAPGLAAVVQRRLRADLADSIRRMGSLRQEAASPRPQPPFHDEDPAAAVTARATAEAQRATAEQMVSRGDPRQWFGRVYQYVTEEMIAACGRGEVAHTTWALRLIPRFHELFARSLDGTPEPHWQEAFAAIDDAERSDSSGPLPFWRALVAGARAHIEGDLPRVLASTYGDHYRDRCDYVRFRADFLLLAAPLQRAWQRLSAEVPPRWFPPYLRVLDRVLPAEAVEHLTAKRFYDPLTARRVAFERGKALVDAPAA